MHSLRGIASVYRISRISYLVSFYLKRGLSCQTAPNALLLQECVDSGGTLLAGTHGQNDGGGTGDGIAAGKHAVTGGHFVLVDDQAALPVGLQTRGGGADQGVAYENYTSNNDATCTANGTETGTCVCGATDTREVANSKLPHSYDDEFDADCNVCGTCL